MRIRVSTFKRQPKLNEKQQRLLFLTFSGTLKNIHNLEKLELTECAANGKVILSYHI